MMKISIRNTLAITLVSVLALSGCSGDATDNAKTEVASLTKDKTIKKENKVDYGEASDSVKSKFVKAFSENCVTRETKNSVNKDIDEKRAVEACTCIAQHIAEDLAEVDAEKYIDDHEDTQTLEIKFDTAAFFCLQNKPQPRGPRLFGKQ